MALMMRIFISITYKVVSVEENVIFRAYYEHIKNINVRIDIYLLYKMKDYLRNSKTLLRGGRWWKEVNNIDIKDVLDNVEEDLLMA